MMPKYQAKPDCKDCKYSFEPNSPALDGHMILIRCSQHKERHRFMKRDGCELYQPKR